MEEKKTLRDHFTAKELIALRKYIEDVKAWSAEEPPKITDEEKISILQYAQEHDDLVPPEYRDRLIISYYRNIYPAIEEHFGKQLEDAFERYVEAMGEPQTTGFHRVLHDVAYDTWYQKIYDIAPAETIIKLIDLINNERINAREVDLLKAYIPEDEDNRQRLEAAIMELLGETVTKEDTQTAIEVFKGFDKNTPLMVPTGNMAGAFRDFPNAKAYMVRSGKYIDFTVSEQGQITIDDIIREKQPDKEIEDPAADFRLYAFFASIIQERRRRGEPTEKITVSIFDLAEVLGIDIRKSQNNEEARKRLIQFMERIETLQRSKGIANKNTIFAGFNLDNIDFKNKVVTFSSPWANYVLNQIDKPAKYETILNAKKVPQKTLVEKRKRDYSEHVRPQIVSARNNITSEIVIYIAQRVAKHGKKPDKDQPYTKGAYLENPDLRTIYISFKDIEKNVSDYWRIIHAENTPKKDINRSIKRIFYGRSWKGYGTEKPQLIEYLEKYTDLFEAYQGFKVTMPETCPTCTDKNALLTITHMGENLNYQKTKQLKFSDLKYTNDEL